MKRPFDATLLTVAAGLPWRLPLYLALLVCCGARILPAQPTLQITSPASGTVLNTGQVFTVTVNATPSAFQVVGVIGQTPLGQSVAVSAPPYQFTMSTPPDFASGVYSLTAVGVTTSGNIVYSPPITVDVERPDSPQQLLSEESGMIFGFVGDTTALGITGVFSDGSRVGLTHSTLIAYSSDTPTVATVDSNGFLTAAGPGFANLTLTYLNLSIQIPVAVPQPVTIAPTVASLFIGQTMQFSAELNITPGVDTSVTWSINPQLGSIDNTGLYTAPSSVVASWQGVAVTATSVANPTISISGQIWLFAPVSVALSPSTATLTAGQALILTPTVVNGGDAINGPAVIIWSISPSGVGAVQNTPTFNQNTFLEVPGGTYYAPGAITSPQTVTITATSGYDNTKAASAQVTLVPSVAVSISPPSATLYVSGSQQFAATLNYSSNATVTWSISPSVGTIGATGLYTAPANIFYQQTVTITATGSSIGGGPNSASATVTLMPQTSAAITPPSALAAAAASNSEIDLSWTASVETGGSIAGYSIFRSGVWIGSSAGPSYADLGLVAGTAYTYTVAAYDAAGSNSASSSPAVASTIAGVTPGLAAYYNFNEASGATLHDYSGNGNNGAITGATWSSSGKYGGALLFQAPASVVTVPNAASLNLAAGMTLEAWVNPTTAPTWNIVMAMYQANEDLSYGLLSTSSGPGAYVNIASGNYVGDQSAFGASALQPGAWTHLAATYDGATLTLYLNGVPAASKPVTGSIIQVTLPLYIGGDPFQDVFAGLIDEVRIYSRALTQAQIQADMATPGQTLTASPTFSPSGGTYTAAQTVTLSTTTAGATIRYTADGSTPSETAGTVYTAPFAVSATATVNAIAYAAGLADSSIATAVYYIMPPVSVGIAPGAVTLQPVQFQQFTASVSNALSTAVAWQITPAGSGSVSTSGMYTAPSSIASSLTVVVTATSVTDATKSASATITLTAPQPSATLRSVYTGGRGLLYCLGHGIRLRHRNSHRCGSERELLRAVQLRRSSGRHDRGQPSTGDPIPLGHNCNSSWGGRYSASRDCLDGIRHHGSKRTGRRARPEYGGRRADGVGYGRHY